jgi:hypothetical protein
MSILNCVFDHWQVAFMLICALDENCIILELSSLLHEVAKELTHNLLGKDDVEWHPLQLFPVHTTLWMNLN